MTSLHFLGKPVASWRDLVAACPDSEFTSGRRSTLALLDCWRDPAKALATLRRELGVSLDQASLRFEHQTPVQDGKGKASHTDLMIEAATEAVAVEGKHTEPQYESVAKWTGETPSENRTKVLDGWLGLISATTGTALTRSDVASVPYQMIHRTASPCAMKRERAFVVYHLFGETPEPEYEGHLRVLARRCGTAAKLRFVILHTSALARPGFSALLNTLPAAEQPAGLVRASLLAAPLYEFGPATVTVVD